MIVLWGANIASQPNTARHIISARRRGAKVVTIDVRRTEAAAQSDEVLLIKPGSDAALALAVMHVIITEKLYDPAFVEVHTAGFAGHATVASLRTAGGFLPLKVPHIAYADRKFDSPSRKIEFYSSQAERLGQPPLT